MTERNRTRDDDRSSRRRDDDDRDEGRRSLSRDRARDDDRRGRDRDDDRRGRDRDDDRGDRRSRDRDDDRDGDRGSRRGGSRSSFTYHARSPETARRRSEMGANEFDRIVKSHLKVWKPNDGLNRIRILPPTWDGADHYGFDLHVHYGVGADRGQYLCLHKMLGKPDPIEEERVRARKEGDEKYAKDIDAKRRVGIYLIDRDHEREGVQFWAMPWTLDRDLVKVSRDRSSGEVLPIDHPDEGFDIEFEKKGSKDRTEYLGVAVARRSTPLGKDEWLDFAVENPIPDQLQYFDYEHIDKAFGGGGVQRDPRSDDRDEDRGGRGRDRDDDRGGRGRDRDDDRGGRGRDKKPETEFTWDDIHAMSGSELEDLVELEGLKINPNKFDSDDELADEICEVLGIREEEKRRPARSSRDEEEDEPRRSGLGEMRARRRVE